MTAAAPIEFDLCWGTVAQASLVELVQAASAHQFHGVTATPLLYRRNRHDGMSDTAVRHLLADAGIRVTVIDALVAGLPGSPRAADVPPEYRASFEVTESDCFQAAEALGADTINVAHFLGRPVPIADLVEVIGGIGARAHRRGLRLALEFMPETGIPDLATALAIVRSIAADNVGIMVDTWHLARSGGTVDDVRALPAGAIAGIQICDRKDVEPGGVYVPMAGRLLPGDGSLPLVAFLDVVRRHAPKLSVGVEVFSDVLRALSADEAARRVAAAVARLA